MCGLTGCVLGRLAKRRVRDIEALTETFTRLLLLSEARGPYATGVAWIKQDGHLRVAKEPWPARHFVQTGTYGDWLLGVDRQVTYRMGHTRWPTHGSVRNPENNHPLMLPILLSGRRSAAPGTPGLMDRHHGYLVLSHNGAVNAVQHYFDYFGLPRTAQVDSELLARLAQRHTDEHGIDIAGFLDALIPLDGRMSLALVATSRPEEIVLLKGNMPLDVRLHRRKRAVLYASEACILDLALAGEPGWQALPCDAGEALIINTAAIHTPRRYRFTFQGLARTSAWPRYTGTSHQCPR